MKIRSLLLILVLGLTTFLAACNFEGGVEQGRCVAFNPEGKTITIVVDVTHDQFNPHYSGGAHTYKLPASPGEMGPTPVVGGRLMIDLVKGRTVEDARRLIGLYFDMIKGKITPEQLDDLEDVAALQGIAHVPARVKCAVLAWHTLEEALDGEGKI